MAIYPAEYYVRPTNGDDGAAGTSFGAAFKSWAKALSVIAAGETIGLVKEADEQPAGLTTIGTAGTITSKITSIALMADGSIDLTGATIYWLDGQNGMANILKLDDAGYQILDGIGFKNSTSDLWSIVGGISTGCIINNCHGLDGGRYGLGAGAVVRNALFKKCTSINSPTGNFYTYESRHIDCVAKGADGTGRGFYSQGAECSFESCIAHDNVGPGFYSIGNWVRYNNCISDDNGQGFDLGNMLGVAIDDCRITHNTIGVRIGNGYVNINNPSYYLNGANVVTGTGAINEFNRLDMASGGYTLRGSDNFNLTAQAEARRTEGRIDGTNKRFWTGGIPGEDLTLPSIVSISTNTGSVDGGTSLSVLASSQLVSGGHTISLDDVDCTTVSETISGTSAYVTIDVTTPAGDMGEATIKLTDSNSGTDSWIGAWEYVAALAPDSPSSITVSVVGETSLMPYWTFVPNVVSFDVYRSLEEDDNFSLIANVTTSSYVDTGLSADTTYFYKVKSRNANGVSAFSDVAYNKTLNETQVGRVFYYPKTIRSIIVGLLDMFNNITVQRYDKSGTLVRTIDVPILFAPQEKYWQLKTRSGADYPEAYWTAPVPRIGLVMSGLAYNGSRAKGVNSTRDFYNTALGLDDITEFINNVQPAPYDFTFTLFIRTDSLTDYAQIMEQILPYFNPSLSLRMKEFSFLNVERDLKVTLDGITPDFLESQDKETKRHINGEISLTVQGNMYRPVTSEKVIHSITTNYLLLNTLSDSISANTFNINISGDTTGEAYL